MCVVLVRAREQTCVKYNERKIVSRSNSETVIIMFCCVCVCGGGGRSNKRYPAIITNPTLTRGRICYHQMSSYQITINT